MQYRVILSGYIRSYNIYKKAGMLDDLFLLYTLGILHYNMLASVSWS